jgi:isocitrate dehydrogenase
MYWARALADQTKSEALRARFGTIAAQLEANEQKIVDELIAVQGKPVVIGGYYHPNPELTAQAMRPSSTLNAILATV